MQRAAAIKAGRHLAAHCAGALFCLLLAGCASDSEPPPAAVAPVATAAPAPEPELSAEPEVLRPVPTKRAAQHSIRKAAKIRKPAHGHGRAVAKAAPPPPSFHCHIVRESDIEGATAQPPGADPTPVDLYAKIDPQAHSLTIERASDPAFAQSGPHCGDGKASPAALKAKPRRRGTKPGKRR